MWVGRVLTSLRKSPAFHDTINKFLCLQVTLYGAVTINSEGEVATSAQFSALPNPKAVLTTVVSHPVKPTQIKKAHNYAAASNQWSHVQQRVHVEGLLCNLHIVSGACAFIGKVEAT